MNIAQKILVDNYAGGEFSHVETEEEANEVGDSLFSFLFIELSDEQDCESLSDADRRMRIVMDDLREVAVKIERAYLESGEE